MVRMFSDPIPKFFYTTLQYLYLFKQWNRPDYNEVIIFKFEE